MPSSWWNARIGTDLGGKYVLVVGEDDVVELRHLELGAAEGDLRVVTAGLRPDERYVANGVQRARPGLPVTPMMSGTPDGATGRGAAAHGRRDEALTMFSRFFIHRPVFAFVVSIVIALLGAVAVPSLPIEETPDITPPTVSVTGMWPGASAPAIADNVAVPIEQQVNGVDDMLYLSSISSDDGSVGVTVTFEVGVDVDMATVLVQNRVAAAEPLLPEELIRQGLTTRKQSTNMVQVVSLLSPDGPV